MNPGNIGFDMGTYIINHLEQNVTLTFYFVGQMWVKRAKIYLNYYISQCIGHSGSSLIRSTRKSTTRNKMHYNLQVRRSKSY